MWKELLDHERVRSDLGNWSSDREIINLFKDPVRWSDDRTVVVDESFILLLLRGKHVEVLPSCRQKR